MKRRWSVLFWCVLTSLIGASWLATTFGLSTMSMFGGVGGVGLLATAAIAFYAMIRAVPVKWPALAAFICSLPMGFDTLRALPDIAWFIEFLGLPGALWLGGTAATVATEIWILATPVPPPPAGPPVPPARVVD